MDGTIYGIPKDFNTLAVFYNKDLFDYAGVEYPNNEDTWDTFYAKLEQVAAIDPDIYGLALQPEFARFGALAFAAGFTPSMRKARAIFPTRPLWKQSSGTPAWLRPA